MPLLLCRLPSHSKQRFGRVDDDVELVYVLNLSMGYGYDFDTQAHERSASGCIVGDVFRPRVPFVAVVLDGDARFGPEHVASETRFSRCLANRTRRFEPVIELGHAQAPPADSQGKAYQLE